MEATGIGLTDCDWAFVFSVKMETEIRHRRLADRPSLRELGGAGITWLESGWGAGGPEAGVILGQDGNLYGNTPWGGLGAGTTGAPGQSGSRVPAWCTGLMCSSPVHGMVAVRATANC
jgi:hypothetical protein